ncbi:MAG: hypothetical protein R3F60_33620, partial [bacterium]
MRPITLAAGLVLALAAEGLAQPAACIVAANDGLAAARRARSAVADQAAYQRAVDLRRAALVATDAAHGIQDPWMLQTHLLIATTAVQGYELCGEQADLAGDLTAVGAEWRTTDGEWGAGISLVSGGDSLSPADFRATEAQPVSPDAVGRGYVFWLAEVQATSWAQVGYGQIHDAKVRISLGNDASGATASNTSFDVTDDPAWHVVVVGVPRLSVRATVVIGEALDLGELAAVPVPIPGAAGLEVGGRLRRLGDEDVTATGVELAYPLLDDRLRPSVAIEAAWPDASLRATRLRVDG